MSNTITLKPGAKAQRAAKVKGPFEGQNSNARNIALLTIAPFTFGEHGSRAAAIAACKVALGAAPTAEHIKLARNERIVGYVAAHLPAGEFPAGCSDDVAKLEHARNVALNYASAPQEGSTPRKLKPGQAARRSARQESVFSSAKAEATRFLADAGYSNAKTTETRVADNAAAAKREPHRNDGESDPDTATLSKAEIKAELAKPVDGDAYSAMMLAQSNALAGFDRKHAKVRPIEYSEAADLLAQFRRACLKAENTRGENKARAKAS